MNLANKVTIARILLIPFFIILIVYYNSSGLEILRFLALAIFLASVLSDAIDGYIARTYRQKTEFGTFLDPIADKLLLISAFVVLSVSDNFPARPPIWVPIVVISRDVIILFGSAVIHMVTGRVKVASNTLGKLATLFQMVAICFVLVQVAYPRLIWTIVWGVVAFFTVASGVGYIVRDSRYLNGKGRAS